MGVGYGAHSLNESLHFLLLINYLAVYINLSVAYQHLFFLGSCIFISFMLLFVIVLVLASLAIWAWWIADLVIFATNQRLAGSGCELAPTL